MANLVTLACDPQSNVTQNDANRLFFFLSKLGWQISEVLKIFHVFLSKGRLKEAGWLFSTIKPTDLSRIYFNNIIT